MYAVHVITVVISIFMHITPAYMCLSCIRANPSFFTIVCVQTAIQAIIVFIQQPYLHWVSTPKPGRRGAIRSAEAAWKPQACQDHHLHVTPQTKRQHTVSKLSNV